MSAPKDIQHEIGNALVCIAFSIKEINKQLKRIKDAIHDHAKECKCEECECSNGR